MEKHGQLRQRRAVRWVVAGCVLWGATTSFGQALVPVRPRHWAAAATGAATQPTHTVVTVTPATTAPAAAVAPAAPVMPPPATSEPANHSAVSINKQTRINLAWQVALDAADFSPGIIDGHFKRKSLVALSDYAARFFPGASPFDPKVFAALGVDVDNAVAPYEITADDAAQVGMLPEDWNDKAKLERLPYETLAECMGEKFHCTRAILETLNPGVSMDSLEPGQTINVPNLRPFPTENKAVVLHRGSETGSVTVNLGEKTIRVFDKQGQERALFHCSIAKDKAKLPDRDTMVMKIAAPNPNYTFDPKLWPDVKDVTRVLTIPPGPRNPVGLAWVSLDLPGYGIHGTPKPELIGKTGSHGCFRLTNWDALRFAGFMQVGVPVKIVNPEKEGASG